MAVAIAAGGSLAHGTTAQGSTTFVVNRKGDAPDRNLADAKCDTSSSRGNQCTLRAAIQEANDTPGGDTINFNIGSTPRVIAPNTPLPSLTEVVTIDGYSQPGATPNTQAVGSNAVLKIVLDGVNAGPTANGLEIFAGKAVVKGLVIRRFGGNGVLVSATKASVVGNFIGTNPAGTAAAGNGIGVLVTGDQNAIGGGLLESRNLIAGNGFGVRIQGVDAIGNSVLGNLIGTNAAGSGALPNDQIGVHVVDADLTRIGGTSPETRNVISANGGQGIALQSDANTVVGNLIGTTAAGSAALGNDGNGILAVGSSNVIGGSTEASRNVIADNGGHGISLSGSGADNVIQGNRIGTTADGATDIGNSLSGINVFGPDDTIIGGSGSAGNAIVASAGAGIDISSTAQGTIITGNGITRNARDGIDIDRGSHTIEGNVILANGRAGIFLTGTASGVRIRGNLMQANGGLGIDLETNPSAQGVTNNDTDDPDSGPNGLQNYPRLASAVHSTATKVTTIGGSINSDAGVEFRIDLYLAAPDPTQFGEGLQLLASQLVTTDAGGDKTFTFVVTHGPGSVLTATALRTSNGSTSEFSQNRTVVAGP